MKFYEDDEENYDNNYSVITTNNFIATDSHRSPNALFREYMDLECHDIDHGKKPSMAYLKKNMTKTMWREFAKEFEYFYGAPPKSFLELGTISFGYTERMIRYMYKCLRYFITSPSPELRQDILEFYDLAFKKRKRCWPCEELDELETHMKVLFDMKDAFVE